jgi:hypothetical protein
MDWQPLLAGASRAFMEKLHWEPAPASALPFLEVSD